MSSLSSFNDFLDKYLSENGYTGITKDYDIATYVVGDFTASLGAAYNDVYNAYPNWYSDGKTHYHEDGSVVYQGQNSPYNVAWNNCLDRTYAAFGLGTLANGISAKTYMANCGFTGGMRPDNAAPKFA